MADALPGDPRDALIAAHAERIEALVADLREQMASGSSPSSASALMLTASAVIKE